MFVFLEFENQQYVSEISKEKDRAEGMVMFNKQIVGIAQRVTDSHTHTHIRVEAAK